MLPSSLLLFFSDAFRSSDEPSEYPIRLRVEAEAIGKLDDLAVERADLGAPANMKIADHRRPMTRRRRDHLLVKNFSIFCRAGKGEGNAERARDCERLLDRAIHDRLHVRILGERSIMLLQKCAERIQIGRASCR